MTNESSFPPWPPANPFPESIRPSGVGRFGSRSAFPGSAGDRERGKFRPGGRDDTTVVASANDDGSPIMAGTLAETNLYLRAVIYGLEYLADRLARPGEVVPSFLDEIDDDVSEFPV